MSALVFAVQHRSVDLVAMSALRALRGELGLGDELASLRRDELTVIEGATVSDADGWVEACTHTQHWFNPNKHRFALFAAEAGATAAAAGEGDWPDPWLDGLLASDRPDLRARLQSGDAPSGEAALRAWLALGEGGGGAGAPSPLSFAVWQHEGATGPLPAGPWPDRQRRATRLVLWSLGLPAGREAELAPRALVARSRREGLLVNPHVEGLAQVLGPPLEGSTP